MSIRYAMIVLFLLSGCCGLTDKGCPPGEFFVSIVPPSTGDVP